MLILPYHFYLLFSTHIIVNINDDIQRDGVLIGYLNTNNKEILLMSNENYTNCSNQELVDLVFKLNNGKHTNRLKFLIKRDNPNLFDEILKRTNFVPE